MHYSYFYAAPCPGADGEVVRVGDDGRGEVLASILSGIRGFLPVQVQVDLVLVDSRVEVRVQHNGRGRVQIRCLGSRTGRRIIVIRVTLIVVRAPSSVVTALACGTRGVSSLVSGTENVGQRQFAGEDFRPYEPVLRHHRAARALTPGAVARWHQARVVPAGDGFQLRLHRTVPVVAARLNGRARIVIGQDCWGRCARFSMVNGRPRPTVECNSPAGR